MSVDTQHDAGMVDVFMFGLVVYKLFHGKDLVPENRPVLLKNPIFWRAFSSTTHIIEHDLTDNDGQALGTWVEDHSIILDQRKGTNLKHDHQRNQILFPRTEQRRRNVNL